MDNKITKSRLANLLAYDWVKICAVIVAVCFVWVLAYTIGAPRASVGQVFGLLTYAPDFEVAKSGKALLGEAETHGAFSYDILDFNMRDMPKDYYSTLMMAADSVQEGDVFITSDFAETIKKNESPLRTFIDGYYGRVYNIDLLISDAKEYARKNGIIQNADGTYGCDKTVTDSLFSSRMEKDPRFRDENSKKYAEGQQNEYERIIAVWNNACKAEKLLEEHPELRINYRPFTQTLEAMGEEEREKSEYYKTWLEQKELTYAINLGKLTGGANNITDLYARTITPEDGEPYLSADGVALCVFDYAAFQPHLQYETLGYIVYMAETYSNFLTVQPENLVVNK